MKRKRITELPIVPACAMGIFGCFIISLLLLLMLAISIHNEHLQINTGRFITIIMHFFSAFLGSLLAGKAAGEKWRMVSAVTGAGYIVTLFVISLLFGDGINGNILWTIISILLGCCFGMLVCARKKTAKRPKQKKRFR